jgi:hypothetical protein
MALVLYLAGLVTDHSELIMPLRLSTQLADHAAACRAGL